MANLKDIKRRIGSVKKTRQITSAMKLVAAAKLRRATEAAQAARPYQQQLSGLLGRVGSKVGDSATDPLLQSSDTVSKVLVVVLTSDRGLCGAFNNTLLKRSMEFFKELPETDIVVYGTKGKEFFKAKGASVHEEHAGYTSAPKMELVRPLCEGIVTGFTNGTYDEVYVIYNLFVNAITQTPTFSKVLPMRVDASDDDSAAASSSDYLYEPSAEEVLAKLLPLYLQITVLNAFLQTEAGEHAARMTAMENATKNAGEMIDKLTLTYNRARQAAITTEITEIVSGAEALQ